MEAWTLDAINWLLHTFAIAEVGLSAIFIISLISATLLPLGSEPVVLAYVGLSPSMFWPAVIVATIGNTIGGTISYYMGLGAASAYESIRKTSGRWHHIIHRWLYRLGPKALLLSWLPIVGDPLCALAGWMRLPLGPSIIYMAIGKFLRYSIMTAVILWLIPHLGFDFLDRFH